MTTLNLTADMPGSASASVGRRRRDRLPARAARREGQVGRGAIRRNRKAGRADAVQSPYRRASPRPRRPPFATNSVRPGDPLMALPSPVGRAYGELVGLNGELFAAEQFEDAIHALAAAM